MEDIRRYIPIDGLGGIVAVWAEGILEAVGVPSDVEC